MQIAALQRLINQWKDNPKVIRCVHDYDTEASKEVHDAGWNVTEYYDLKLFVKEFNRGW
jgi:hypothetical protein